MGLAYEDGTHTHKISVGSALYFPAPTLLASAAGPALAVSDAIHQAWLLDSTASEQVSTGFWGPPGWTAVDVFYHGFNNGAGSGGVALGIYLEDLLAGADVTAETPTIANATVFTAGAQNILQIISGPTGLPITPDGFNSIKVGRLPADAGDTLGNDYALLGVLLRRAA